MLNLQELDTFVRIVEAGGISAAARQMDTAKSAISKRLGQLESQLGCKLINRTTRQQHLTEAGQQLYQRALVLLDEAADIQQQISAGQQRPSGTLRMALPITFGLHHMSELIADYRERYPDIQLVLAFSDHQTNLVAEGIDLSLRIGKLADSSHQARVICPMQLFCVASPDYLARHGTPSHPSQLAEHPMLRYGALAEVQLHDPQGNPWQVPINGSLQADNGDFIQSLVIAGQGIAFSPEFICHQALASGQLVRILPHYTLADIHCFALYPRNRHLGLPARLMIDMLLEYFAEQQPWQTENNH